MKYFSYLFFDHARRPFWWAFIFFLVGLDQLSKFFIVRFIPINTISWEWGDGFFRLIHVRNLGVLFSLGNSLGQGVRLLVFIIVPALFLLYLIWFSYEKTLLSSFRWVLAGVIGGGLGNLLDRIFRPQGVVDFLDFAFYGLLGLQRWPAFNLADSFVFISLGIGFFLWLYSFNQERMKKKDER